MMEWRTADGNEGGVWMEVWGRRFVSRDLVSGAGSLDWEWIQYQKLLDLDSMRPAVGTWTLTRVSEQWRGRGLAPGSASQVSHCAPGESG